MTIYFDDETIELKPCPFCGKKPGVITWATPEDEGLVVHCEGDDLEEGCDLYYEYPAWNKRPIEDDLLAACEAIVKNLPESEIELAREVWGNTNTRIILDIRGQLQAAIAKARE